MTASRDGGAVSLRSGMLWTLGSNVVYAAAQFGMLSVLAHLGTPAKVGVYNLGLAVTAPVFMLLALQLRGAQATDTKGEYEVADYVTLRTLSTALGVLVVAAISLAFYPQAFAAIALLTVARVFEAQSDVLYGAMQARDRLDLVGRSLLWRGPLGLLLLALGFVLSGDVAVAAGGVALANALVFFAHDLPLARRLAPHPWWRPQLPTLARLARLTLPLGVVMGLISLSANVPRYVLERAQGEDALGIFSALAYVTVAGNIVVNALGQSANVRLARLHASGERAAFWKLLGQLFAAGGLVGLLGVLVAVVAGRPLLTLLFGAEYGAFSEVFVWLMLAGAVGYVASFAGFGITSVRRFSEQVPLFVAVTLVLLGLCLWWVPTLGLTGAAFALLAASVVQLIGSLVIIARAA